MQKRDRCELREWRRPGWTFHAKGIWCDWSERVETVVGSSNYGKQEYELITVAMSTGFRSLERDLEAQVVLTTTNAGLMQRLREVIGVR